MTKKNYFEPVILSNLNSNNYIEYESDSSKNALPIKEYLDEIKSQLKDILNDHKMSDTWKNQVKIIKVINFITPMKSMQCN